MKNKSAISTAITTHRNITKKKFEKLHFYYMENLTFAIVVFTFSYSVRRNADMPVLGQL